jgi:predicted amidohydrolase YtcJ
LQQRVQACLNQSPAKSSEAWLEVVGWFQEGMLPPGVRTNRAMLDTLKTTRPIIIRSSFGHTVLANSKALKLAKITSSSPEPIGGKIWHDEKGEPTGVLEDSAFEIFSRLIPRPSAAARFTAAKAALNAISQQGVTSFLDAAASEEDLLAFQAVRKTGQLTARAHFAPVIEPAEAPAPALAIARTVALAKNFDGGPIVAEPGITVRSAKLFLDGVISAPSFTGALRQPYMVNAGSESKPDWVPGTSRGAAVYFPARDLATILIGLGQSGLDPHLHADGDEAVHAALDGIEAMRQTLATADIRPAIAHDELVDPEDFPRFKSLGAIPVLSMQWQKPAGDTMGLSNYLGAARMKIIEPAGLLQGAGARIAFGSDWPVDRLDEWFAFKVGVTRTNNPDVDPAFAGRLGEDPGLTPEEVLRAATINAAYELHEDAVTGSLEVGKLADLIVLDRNPLAISAEDIAKVRVLETVVGGKVVYREANLF